jgi:1-acyl-sn-glycerol-3-phosphate acyltransferase
VTTDDRGLLAQARIPFRVATFAAYCAARMAQYEAESRTIGETSARQLDYIRAWGRTILRLWNVDLTARGPHVGKGDQVPQLGRNGKGRIFVSNHRSMLDVAVTIELCRGRHVSRADLSGWPLIGLLARRSGTLFVDRGSKKSGAAVVQAMIAQVEMGEAVIIFPEGTTYAGDEVRPFRHGAFTAARRTGAEIVPIGLAYEGAAASFGDETFTQHLMRISRAGQTRCGAVVGAPIPSEGLELEVLEARTHEVMQGLVNEARALLAMP